MFVYFHNDISGLRNSEPLPLQLSLLFLRDSREAGFGAGRVPLHLTAHAFLLSAHKALLSGLRPRSPTVQTHKTHIKQFRVEACPMPMYYPLRQLFQGPLWANTINPLMLAN